MLEREIYDGEKKTPRRIFGRGLQHLMGTEDNLKDPTS